MWTGGWWPRIEDSGGGSFTGRQRRVATLIPGIRETRKRERVKHVDLLLVHFAKIRIGPWQAQQHNNVHYSSNHMLKPLQGKI